MPIIKCKMCGGDIELAADKTFGTCEYCGSTMTLPKVSDDQRAAAFNRGNHFRRMGEFDKALGVYERIVAEDDTDAEAHWCCALSRFGIEYVEDPATYEWLPTCHRASFDSFLEDVDYLAAVEHSDGITRRQYQKDAAKIAEVQRGILATSQNTEPYNVFISYKELDENGERTRDSILAQEIYYRLTEKGWRVFFSRITLEDVPGTQYEPYIFAALNSAKVMIVVGTSAENLNAVWVKNEWSRFLSMMRKDKSKLLIPCYRDMDPYDLPEQLSVLMSYDMGKIGFIQDLIRGVDKVLSAEKKEHEPVKETVKETVVIQQGGGPNVTALLKRGQQALEDGEWDKAKEFYDQVLNMDAENAEAFFGLFLTGAKCRDEREYIERVCAYPGDRQGLSVPLDKEREEKAVKAFTLKDYLNEDAVRKLFQFDPRYYTFTRENRQQHAAQQKKLLRDDRNYARAVRFAKGEAAARLDRFKSNLSAGLDAAVGRAAQEEAEAIAAKKKEYETFLAEAEKKAEVLSHQATEKKEADYQALCKRADSATTEKECFAAAQEFETRFVGYKDSSGRIKKCQDEAARLQVLRETEEVLENAALKKKRIIAGIIAAMAIAAFLIVTKVVIPSNYYKAAEALFEAGNYEEAIAAFEALNGYKDSAVKIEEARKALDLDLAALKVAAEKAAEGRMKEEAVFSMRPSLDITMKHGSVSGVLVSDVSSGSTAEKAGILAGNVITKFNGKTVKTPEEIKSLLRNAGQTAEIEIFPGGKTHTVTVSLNESKSLGVSVGNITENLGLVVVDLVSGGVSEKAGILPGDMILEIDGQPCMTTVDFDRVMNARTVGDTVKVSIMRNDEEQIFDVTLGASDFGILENIPSHADVSTGTNIPLFSVQAKGDLNGESSFTWTVSYEDKEYGIIVMSDYHTGDKDEDLGFFVETVFNEETQIFTSTLWAYDITAKADGCTCFCSITDKHGWSMKSDVGTVRVK